MTDRTRRNDDDMEQDDQLRSGKGQVDSEGRSTSSQRTDDDDDRGGMNRGDDPSRRSTGHTTHPQKKK